MLGKVWRKGNLPTLLVGMESDAALWRTVWRSLRKLKTELPHDTATLLLGIYQRKTWFETVRASQCSL